MRDPLPSSLFILNPQRPTQAVWRYVYALMLVVTTTAGLVLLRERLTIANISLIYMLVTLIASIWLGILPSLFVAALSFFSFNFFLVRPYYTLIVEDPRELLDLIIFLIAAVITGRLAGFARQQAETVRRNAAEQEILLDLSTALNPLTGREAILNEFKQVVVNKVGAVRVVMMPHEPAPTADRSIEETDLIVVVEAGDRFYGTLHATFPDAISDAQNHLLRSCATQAAIALQRVELMEQAHHSRSLAEADRLKTALLQAVSHDLRTPITIIKTSASNLDELSDQLSADQQQELARTIENQADRLNALVGNLLDMSRLQAGAMILNSEWNSLEEIAGEVAARTYQSHQSERILLDFPADLPLVNCDYGLILQALENIVENALRYEPAGNLVIIRGQIDESFVSLEIINHGVNISPAEKERVTKPFYQGDPRQSVVGRVGLGLAIARGIVEAHHGDLNIVDTPGGGVTFTIALPRQEMTT
jgi:two-component system, OmpR family, sensor histidine kinase KdpD